MLSTPCMSVLLFLSITSWSVQCTSSSMSLNYVCKKKKDFHQISNLITLSHLLCHLQARICPWIAVLHILIQFFYSTSSFHNSSIHLWNYVLICVFTTSLTLSSGLVSTHLLLHDPFSSYFLLFVLDSSLNVFIFQPLPFINFTNLNFCVKYKKTIVWSFIFHTHLGKQEGIVHKENTLQYKHVLCF